MPLVEIPLAARGLTGERSPTKLRPGDLVRCENAEFFEGLVEKEGGTRRLTQAALGATVLAGHDYFPTGTAQRRVVALANGRLLKDDGSGLFATTLKTGLTANAVTQFLDAGAETGGAAAKLFACNGVNPVQVLAGDGTGTTDLATPPADWSGTNQPSFLVPFLGGIGGGGNLNFANQFYLSRTANHETFTGGDSQVLPIFPRAGVRLVAGINAFGRLFLWKHPRGVYFIDDVSGTLTNLLVKEVSAEYGAPPTPHCVTQIDEAVVAFVSQTGNIVLMQESSGTLSGVAFTDLTKVLNLRQIVREQFNLARLDRLQCRWFEEHKELHVLFAALGSSVENRRLVIDFNDEDRPRASIQSTMVATALWTERNDAEGVVELVVGDTSGHVWTLHQTERVAAGAAYTLVLQTAPDDFSGSNARFSGLKNFRRLHLDYDAQGDFEVLVETIIDGRTKGPIGFNMGAASTQLAFDLPEEFEGTALRRRSRALAGQGVFFSMRLTEEGPNNPRIARAVVEFDVSGVGR